MRRRQQNADQQIDERIQQLVERNTYGGTKDGKPALRQMPMISTNQGIRMEWDNRADKYPSIIHLRMTDGEWVEYHIAIPHQGFKEAMDSLKSGSWETGYPRKKP